MGKPLDPIDLAGRQLRYLEQRQRVLAQNIANADTPQYQPRDLVPFAQTLSRAAQLGVGPGAGMARTDARHMVSAAAGADGARRDRQVSERSIDGNAVSLDEQALKVAETDKAHALALNLHRSWLTLFRTALGRN